VGPVDDGRKEVTGKRTNELIINKPNKGYVAVNNEYNALSISIDETPDPPLDNDAVAAAADCLSKAIRRKKKPQSPSQRHVRHV
jgi:hypothetical protein